jgi:hypothetical protein
MIGSPPWPSMTPLPTIPACEPLTVMTDPQEFEAADVLAVHPYELGLRDA